METYFKIKLVETLVGYAIFGLIVLGLLLLLIIAKICDVWEKRQNKRSEEFWKNH